MAATLELNGAKGIRGAELRVLADGPLLGLDVISGEAALVLLVLEHRDAGSEANMLADQTSTATPGTHRGSINSWYQPVLIDTLKARKSCSPHLPTHRLATKPLRGDVQALSDTLNLPYSLHSFCSSARCILPFPPALSHVAYIQATTPANQSIFTKCLHEKTSKNIYIHTHILW